MPIRSRTVLGSDPAIGKIFDNLGAMFAPPSATDLYANAKAQQTRNQTEALNTAAAIAATPGEFNKLRFDQEAVLGGVLNGTNGFTAQDKNNATTRYGTDTTAATSRANNAADNDRALREAIMKDGTDRYKFKNGDVNVAQNGVTLLSPDRAETFGRTDPMVRGNVSANRGETVFPSGGGAPMVGAPMPRTKAEVEGDTLAALPASERRAAALAQVPTENVVGRDGLTQIIMRPDAVGMQPAAAPVAVQPSDIGKLQQERDFIRATSPHGANDPRVAEINDRMAKLGGGGTSVTVNNKGEDAFGSALGTAEAKAFQEMSTDGLSANEDKGQIQDLRQNLAKLPGGPATAMQAMASRAGIKLGPNVSNLEAAQATLARMIPKQRVAGSGTTSDRDAEQFRMGLPQLLNTPGGNELVMHTLESAADYRIAQSQIATQVLNGKMTREEGRNALQALPSPFAAFRKPDAAAPGALGAPAVAAPGTLGTATAEHWGRGPGGTWQRLP